MRNHVFSDGHNDMVFFSVETLLWTMSSLRDRPLSAPIGSWQKISNVYNETGETRHTEAGVFSFLEGALRVALRVPHHNSQNIPPEFWEWRNACESFGK